MKKEKTKLKFETHQKFLKKFFNAVTPNFRRRSEGFARLFKNGINKGVFMNNLPRRTFATVRDFLFPGSRAQRSAIPFCGAGFTLIETIIYIAILGMIAIAFVLFSVSVSGSRNKTYVVQEVQANTRMALEMISQKIRSADGINFNSSTFGINPGRLSLSMTKSSLNPTIIDLSGADGALRIIEGTSSVPLQFEIGSVSTDENWKTVAFQNNYINPVIVASYQELNNTLPASVRIKNASSTGFEVRLQNPSGSNLASDTITYFVIEKGVWNINGVLVEANKYDTNTTGSSGGGWLYDLKTFSQAFTADPIVLHQVMTYNDPAWITTYVSSPSGRWNPPTIGGMRIALNAAEAATSHGTETIGWIAMTMNATTTSGGIPLETYRTSDSVLGHDNGCYTFNYQNTYANSPLVLGFQEEMDGANGGWSVTCSNSPAQAGFHVEEDQVADSERAHTSETMAFLAFEAPVSYSDAKKNSLSITSNKVKITNLVFTNLTGSSSKDNVRLDVTAEYDNIGTNVEYDYSQSFRTAVGVRR